MKCTPRNWTVLYAEKRKVYNKLDTEKSAKGVRFMKMAVYYKQFKLSAVKLACAGASSVASVAKEPGISRTSSCGRLRWDCCCRG